MTANGIRHGLTPEANSLGQTTRAHAHTAWPYAAPLSQRRIKYHRARRSSAELAQRPTAAATTVSGGKRETFRAHKRPTRELRPRLLSTVFLVVVVLVPIRSVRRRHAALTPLMTHKHAHARGVDASRFRSGPAQRASRAARTLVASVSACVSLPWRQRQSVRGCVCLRRRPPGDFSGPAYPPCARASCGREGGPTGRR